MRIATYNVEWFNALFTSTGDLDVSDAWSARWNITKKRQIKALRHVFKALDADAIMIIEAPDHAEGYTTAQALETFAAYAGLRARKAIAGFKNHTQQEIALLYDPNALTPHHAPGGSIDFPSFDKDFRRDLDVDDQPDAVTWSKPPLELSVTTAKGTALRMIGVHAKSKAPHGAKDEADAMRLSIANRRKQLAQCIWLRGRVSEHLRNGEHVMVMGDFNDGPGLDRYEQLFGRSGVEIVLGAEGETPLFDPHASAPLRPGAPQVSTARFFKRRENRYFNALLDFIMVSPDLAPLGQWRVLHPFDDPACFDNKALRRALLAASDHFPVVLEIDI